MNVILILVFATKQSKTKFKLLTRVYRARLAQLVEHETLNLRVVGSSPTLGANTFCYLFQKHCLFLALLCIEHHFSSPIWCDGFLEKLSLAQKSNLILVTI